MSIGIEGTFEYSFLIPEREDPHVLQAYGERWRTVEDRKRLVGWAPALRTENYQPQPWHLYARVTLTATDPEHAIASEFRFSIDRALIRTLKAGDVLHVSRTSCGGLGLSIVRDEELIGAAGALDRVPLGRSVLVRTPLDLVERTSEIYRARDPKYVMSERPIQIEIEGAIKILTRGRPQIGPFDVRVRHGHLSGIPGTDMSLSIERRGVCPDTAAHTTAELFEQGDIQIIR